jgi:hypothetical protein
VQFDYGVVSYVANDRALGHITTQAPFRAQEKQTMADISDGLSNTVFFTEANSVTRQYGSADGFGYPLYHVWNWGRGEFEPMWCPLFNIVNVFEQDNPNYVSGAAAKFQVLCDFSTDGHPNACNWRVPNAPRTAGIYVGLGDGSSRMVGANVDGLVWWRAIEPDEGDMLPADW